MMKDCIIDEEIYRIEYIYVSTKFCSHILQTPMCEYHLSTETTSNNKLSNIFYEKIK